MLYLFRAISAFLSAWAERPVRCDETKFFNRLQYAFKLLTALSKRGKHVIQPVNAR